MGRLIDADEVDDAIYKCFEGIQFYDGTGYDIYSDSKESIDKIPTVEAIPKDQYETRLKADIVAMFKELQLEIEGMDSREHECRFATQCCINRDVAVEIIQEKINALEKNKI